MQPRFDRVDLYENSDSEYFLVGQYKSLRNDRVSVLRIDRTPVKVGHLSEILSNVEAPDGSVISTRAELEAFFVANQGLLRLKQGAVGVVGFIRFLNSYYLTLVTEAKEVGRVDSHGIFAIKHAEVVPIKPGSADGDTIGQKLWSHLTKNFNRTTADVAESRYVGLFQFIDLSKDFYFSYSYDITRSLQHHALSHSPTSKQSSNKNTERAARGSGTAHGPSSCHSAMREGGSSSSSSSTDTELRQHTFRPVFHWNRFQLEEFSNTVPDFIPWGLPIINGSFHQQRFSLYGKTLDLILVARRSTQYAGTRFLKRGVSVHGHVANDVEVEQILQQDGPSDGLRSKFASFLQMRGSIPTYWSQEV